MWLLILDYSAPFGSKVDVYVDLYMQRCQHSTAHNLPAHNLLWIAPKAEGHTYDLLKLTLRHSPSLCVFITPHCVFVWRSVSHFCRFLSPSHVTNALSLMTCLFVPSNTHMNWTILCNLLLFLRWTHLILFLLVTGMKV